MLLSRKARDADGGCSCKSSYLNSAMVVIFAGDDSCSRPRLSAVAGRERAAAVEEFAAFSAVRRTPSLRNGLQHAVDDRAINRGLRDQQSRFARSRIVLLATQQVKGPRCRTDTIIGSGVTDSFTRTDQAIGFAYLVASDAVGSKQGHQADAAGHDPFRIGASHMKRRGPDGLLDRKRTR